MKLKNLVGPVVVILAIFWIVTAPGPAAASVTNLGNTLHSWATNVTDFVSQLAN